MNIAKTMDKLQRYSELSDKKQNKLVVMLFEDEEFLEWLFGSNGDVQASRQELEKLYFSLSNSFVLYKITEYLRESDDILNPRTTYYIITNILTSSVNRLNSESSRIVEKYNEHESDMYTTREANKSLSSYKKNLEKIDGLLEEIYGGVINKINKYSNVPNPLIKECYGKVPDLRFILKMGMYVNEVLKSIYEYFGKVGADVYIKWEPFFAGVFTEESISEVVISILLEGNSKIERYKDLPYFDEIPMVWDSLSTFALEELDKLDHSILSRVLDNYINRCSRIMRKHPDTTLRVNLLNTPKEYGNLRAIISKNSDRIINAYGKFGALDNVMVKLSREIKDNNDNHVFNESTSDLKPVSAINTSGLNVVKDVLNTATDIINTIDNVGSWVPWYTDK